MAKGIYVGVNNTARKITKAYVGVDGVPRKVKKAYIGVEGVPRLVYSNNPEKVAVTQLTTARFYPCAVSNPNYAIFAGGRTLTAKTIDTEVYNNALVKSSNYIGFLPVAEDGVTGASIGVYAIAYGGRSNSGTNGTNNNYVNALDINLTRTPLPNLDNAIDRANGAHNSNYAVFLGGTTTNDEGGISNFAVGFTANLSRNKVYLSTSTRERGGASTSALAIFPAFNSATFGINNAFQVQNLSPLAVDRTYPGTATIGDKAVFAGGRASTITSGTVEYYSANGVKGKAQDMLQGRIYSVGTSVEGYAIFTGGTAIGTSAPFASVECYDTSLVRSSLQDLDTPKIFLGGASVGDYAVFAGGVLEAGSNNASGIVDAYKI